MAPKDSVDLPPGWVWEDVWQIDLSRAVDEEGWEYCVEATMGGYGPVEKRYHLCRRRRWVRTRKLVEDAKQKKHKVKALRLKSEKKKFRISKSVIYMCINLFRKTRVQHLVSLG